MESSPMPPYPTRPLEDAKRQYVELFGSAIVMNTYLKIALLCVSLVALGLVFLNVRTQARFASVKPLVIRIDEVGRAQAVQYDALTYAPHGQAPELKYFLVQFVTKHFARMRATVKQQYAESLYFLDAPLADAAIAQDQRDHLIEGFLTGTADETEIEVRNVTLDDLKAAPYKAVVEFDKVFIAYGNRQAGRRETDVAQITFVLRSQIPNAVIPVNPLGLTITYFRVDQAFK
jgi:type IV secretion system protein VirB5